MQELHADAPQAVDAVFEDAHDREKELIRRHEVLISKLQAQAPPTFGDKDQALDDARAEAEKAKSDLLDCEKDLANKQGEVDYWKKRAEAAGKDRLPRGTSGRRRCRS